MTLDLTHVANDSTISDMELVVAFATLIKAMQTRGLVRTKNITGDLGEKYAEAIYSDSCHLPTLSLESTNTADVDAICQEGVRYSIKTAYLSSNRTGVFRLAADHSSENQTFAYLIVVRVDDFLQLHEIYEFAWAQFWKQKQWNKKQGAWFMPLTKKAFASGVRVHPLQRSE